MKFALEFIQALNEIKKAILGETEQNGGVSNSPILKKFHFPDYFMVAVDEEVANDNPIGGTKSEKGETKEVVKIDKRKQTNSLEYIRNKSNTKSGELSLRIYSLEEFLNEEIIRPLSPNDDSFYYSLTFIYKQDLSDLTYSEACHYFKIYPYEDVDGIIYQLQNLGSDYGYYGYVSLNDFISDSDLEVARLPKELSSTDNLYVEYYNGD